MCVCVGVVSISRYINIDDRNLSAEQQHPAEIAGGTHHQSLWGQSAKGACTLTRIMCRCMCVQSHITTHTRVRRHLSTHARSPVQKQKMHSTALFLLCALAHTHTRAHSHTLLRCCCCSRRWPGVGWTVVVSLYSGTTDTGPKTEQRCAT